jgi:hypothetical protein
MNREQFTNWLILEGWECCQYKDPRRIWPLLYNLSTGNALIGSRPSKYARTLEWDSECHEWGGGDTYPPFPFEKIPARHLAAIRKCLRQEGLL